MAKVHSEVKPANPANPKVKDLRETQARATRNVDKMIEKDRNGYRNAATKRHAEQKKERTELRQWSKDERTAIRKDHNERDQAIRADASNEWQSEREYLRKEHADREITTEQYRAKTKEWHADRVERTRKELSENRKQYGEEITDHKEEFQDAWAKMERAHARDERSWARSEKNAIKSFKDMRRDVLAEYRDKLKGEPKGEAARGILGGVESIYAIRTGDTGERSGGTATMVSQRLGAGRIHKASSAESILKHCLRFRGWSRQWRDGGLTGRQHLQLLEDVRRYARAWLRHEAEGFWRQYGRTSVSQYAGRSMGVGSCSTDESPGDDARDRELSGRTLGRESSDWIARSLGSAIASHLGRFFARAKQFIRESILAGVMALRGPDELTADEVHAVDVQVKAQEEYLDRFHREVVANPPQEIVEPSIFQVTTEPATMTPGQFIARAELYGNSVWTGGQNVARAIMAQALVFGSERRVHKKAPGHHECNTCIKQTLLGWQEMGVLREIGDSECMGNCDCYFEWQDSHGNIFVAPQGRHNPKGFNTTGKRLPGWAVDKDETIDLVAEPPKQPLPPPNDEHGGSLIPGEKEKGGNPPEPPKKGWKDAKGKLTGLELGPITPPETPEGYERL
jgi:hypothetical protein